jgi:hypothetical protein
VGTRADQIAANPVSFAHGTSGASQSPVITVLQIAFALIAAGVIVEIFSHDKSPEDSDN